MRSVDKNGKERRQFVAWLVGTIVVPIVAYPTIAENTRLSDIDAVGLLILGGSWALISYLLNIFIKKNLK